MKCWKCGMDNADGAALCVYCGAAQQRSAPKSEVGKALRTLYDRYGCREVLTKSPYLVSGLGDLAADSKKERNLLKSALDAGIGRCYLEQLERSGKPDQAFSSRVRTLLTEDAGLGEKAATDISGWFDEMIGWTAPQAWSSGSAGKDRHNAGEHQTASDAGRDRGKGDQEQRETRELVREADQITRSTVPLPQAPVPSEKSNRSTAFVMTLLFIPTLLLTIYVSPIFSILMIFNFFGMIVWITKLFKRPKRILTLTREGDRVTCSWDSGQADKSWVLAVNGKWVLAGVRSPAVLKGVLPGSTITLGWMVNDKVEFGDEGKV